MRRLFQFQLYKKNNMSELTAELLREWLHYDPTTGVFNWKKSPGRFTPVGAVASNKSRGYITIKLLGVRYRAHRLAWLHVYGTWPSKDIDHKDGNGQNNKLTNLRECSHRQNHQNVAPHADNISGLLGVTWDKQTGRWRARIMVGNRQHNLGRHDTPEEAHAAYLAAKANLHTFNPVPRKTTTKASNDQNYQAAARG